MINNKITAIFTKYARKLPVHDTGHAPCYIGIYVYNNKTLMVDGDSSPTANAAGGSV